jgi:hypothetical protein
VKRNEINRRIERRVTEPAVADRYHAAAKEIGATTLADVHALLESSRDARTLCKAAYVARVAGDRRSTPARLVRLLEREESELVCNEAANALISCSSAPARRSLRRILRTHPSSTARKYAAHALWYFDDDVERMDDLLAAALEDDDPEVRGFAIESVGTSFQHSRRRRRALSQLLPLLAQRDVQIRFWTCYAVACLGDRRDIASLEPLLKDKRLNAGWWSVRREARWAIECLRGAEPRDPLPGEI